MELNKYFDKESLIDLQNELYKVKIRGRLYKLIYELNKDRRISVRNAVGESEKRSTNEGLSQGSIDAGITSSVNLGKGIDDFFETSDEEMFYGSVKILTQSFQDDCLRVCSSPISAQEGLIRLENLANSKLLSFNPLKSCFIFMGKRKLRTHS